MIRLDVFWDPICPWCLIGLTRLNAARATFRELPLALRWRPFRLNPWMPPEGMDRRAYLEAKFGGAEAAARVYGAIAEAALAEGLDLALDAIERTPDTTGAHGLMAGAARAGRADALATVLLRRYFADAEDIGAPEILRAAAAEVGIAETPHEAGGDEAVLAEEAEARRLGIGGVPAYVMEGRPLPGGALPQEAWTTLFARLARVA